ncbi:aldo/keto reductase [Paenibacillus humicola]|uniref:aldo/keto reductase n=1 Tax=Paenibacillus humicola TaxID=3110540 RepID=UPI00237A4B5A|nr:aldo/keto reductase [Paenibacillus humicola]
MKTKPIPGTELVPSVICLGTSKYGDTIDKRTAYEIMDRFSAAGGTFLDTAKVYGEWVPGKRSLSEEIIGDWLADRKNRHDIVLATKGGHPDLDTMDVSKLSREDIAYDVEASLRHLKTDYIDLYWLHRDDPARPVEELVDTLNELVRQGKIRYFGCSNWRSDRIDAAQEYAAKHGLQAFAANQNKWSLAVYPQPKDPSMVAMDRDEYAYHHRTGLTAVPYNAQAGGFFSGKYTADMLRASAEQTNKAGELRTAQNIARLEKAAGLGRRLGLSLTQVSLGYLLSRPFPVFPICGCSNPAQAADSCSAGDVVLPGELVRELALI